MDLILASFYAALIPTPSFTQIIDIYEDTATSCVRETSLAFKAVLLCDPIAFDDTNKLASLLGMSWHCLFDFYIRLSASCLTHTPGILRPLGIVV